MTAVLLNKWVMVGHGGLSEWHYDLSGPQRNDVVIEATRMTSAAIRLDPLLNNGVDVDAWRDAAGFRIVDLSLASRAGQDGVDVRFYGEVEGWRRYRLIGDWGATTLRYSKGRPSVASAGHRERRTCGHRDRRGLASAHASSPAQRLTRVVQGCTGQEVPLQLVATCRERRRVLH